MLACAGVAPLLGLAQDPAAAERMFTNRYCLGEEVDVYEHGRYHQEIAPGVATDRAGIRRLDGELKTPAGHDRDVLEIDESSPLENGTSTQRCAKGIGMIADDALRLGEVARQR